MVKVATCSAGAGVGSFHLYSLISARTGWVGVAGGVVGAAATMTVLPPDGYAPAAGYPAIEPGFAPSGPKYPPRGTSKNGHAPAGYHAETIYVPD